MRHSKIHGINTFSINKTIIETSRGYFSTWIHSLKHQASFYNINVLVLVCTNFVPAARNISHILTFQLISRWFAATYKQEHHPKLSLHSFVLVPFLERAPRIIIHLATNTEKGGGELMLIILPTWSIHAFVRFRLRFRFRFRISWFSIPPSPLAYAWCSSERGRFEPVNERFSGLCDAICKPLLGSELFTLRLNVIWGGYVHSLGIVWPS